MGFLSKAGRGARAAFRILRSEGWLALGISILQYFQYLRGSRQGSLTLGKRLFTPPVELRDIIAADFVAHPYDRTQMNTRHTKTASWVMSPPGNGGGHQNIFRFIDFLIDDGWTIHVYMYSVHHMLTVERAKANVASYSRPERINFHQWNGTVVDSDVVFATGWETAYPVFNVKTDGAKYYFVQDFEPKFYPTGSTSLLAENTYRFGFHGITAGGWLKHKLETEYGMECDAFEFGVDSTLYRYGNPDPRKEVFFYARPVTERRAFEVGVLALKLFHDARPNYVINLAGWDVAPWEVPFPYVNHKSLKIENLPPMYDRCAVALVLSLTNMSLLPMDLLSAGVIPVVNDGPNNRMVSDNPYIHYVVPTVQALADEMVRLVDRQDLPTYAAEASRSVQASTWAAAGQRFVAVIDRVTNPDA